MRGYGREVRDLLSGAGCTFVRHGRGDHDIWRSPLTAVPFTVPVTIQSRHTADKVSRDAGLPKAF